MTKRYLLIDEPGMPYGIFLNVLLAISPVIAWAIYLYGFRPITLILLCVASVFILDTVFSKLRTHKVRTDLSCAVTGVIAALLLPASSPLWLPVFVGALAGTIRNVFGGLGKNPINPAATSLLISRLLFSKTFSVIPKIFERLNGISFTVNAPERASENPLSVIIGGRVPDTSLDEAFFGFRAGMMGEMSAFLLIVAGIYLVCRRIAKPVLPAIFLLTIGVITYIKPTLVAASDTVAISGSIHNMIGSSTILCAVFMLTDPVTSPKTIDGSVFAGFAGGIATVLVRYCISVEASALVGVLCANGISVITNKYLRPVPFGGEVKKQSK